MEILTKSKLLVVKLEIKKTGKHIFKYYFITFLGEALTKTIIFQPVCLRWREVGRGRERGREGGRGRREEGEGRGGEGAILLY